MQYEVHGPWRSVILAYTEATCEHAIGSHSAQGPDAWRCFPPDKTYRSDKKLKRYACRGISLPCTTIRQKIYTCSLMKIATYPLDKSEQALNCRKLLYTLSTLPRGPKLTPFRSTTSRFRDTMLSKIGNTPNDLRMALTN